MAADLPRPLTHLNDLTTRYPGAWRAFEDMRSRRGDDLPEWPEWVYVPVAGAYAIVSGGGSNRVPLERVGDVAALSALGAWRMTKGTYRFDADIMGALWDTPLTGDLPAELLHRLPEWCVYIDVGREVMGAPLHGFYAHLEEDANDRRRELRLLLDYETGLSPLPIHLVGTLAEGLTTLTHEAELQAALRGRDINVLRARLGYEPGHDAHWAGAVAPLVSLLLYLCSERPDITGDGKPGNPQPKRVKGGERVFASPGVKAWDVAYRLGAAFRQARAAQDEGGEATGRTVRAHVRRAHYHLYRTGKGRQQSVLKWLPPIPVAFGDEELPAVVRRVKNDE